MDAKVLIKILTDYKNGDIDFDKAAFNLILEGCSSEEGAVLLHSVEADRNINIAKKVSDKFGNSK